MTVIRAEQAREAIAQLPEGTSYGAPPALKDVYLPPSHLKAMDLNVSLVTGMRGAGKTFWWSALQQSDVRRLIDRSSVRSALKKDTQVAIGFGFGSESDPDDYPDTDVLSQLMTDHDPRTIWRTVLARHLAPGDHPLQQNTSWPERVAWTVSNPEAVSRLLYDRDRALDRRDRHVLILFDALDRSAHNWQDMYRAIRGLLQLALEMRSYRRLRLKIFLRSDQIDESRVADFPDASKVLSSSVELSWPRRELYGLLWHSLVNGEKGKPFRRFLGGSWKPIGSGTEKVFPVPRGLADEDVQRAVFHELSGPFMGKNRRRGFPYSWIVTHLGDGMGHTSPRSFLAALRSAAQDTDQRYPTHSYALHYESIKRGVQAASGIRVREIREDYLWIDKILRPLAGMNVPAKFRELEKRWPDALADLTEESKSGSIKQSPRHIAMGAAGVREDLEAVGVFRRLLDDRVNIPDIFRVGHGIGRRGGVKPVR